MNNSVGTSPVADEELLARFILESSRFRSNNTVKPEAFMPHPHKELSVTRHRDLTVEELWRIGQDVANARARTLYGKADVGAGFVRSISLQLSPEPVSGNPNHANIFGWPAEKSAQKEIAIRLSLRATFQPFPA